MDWNFHNYYSNKTDGLISKLKLNSEKISTLKALRKLVRNRIKDVFEEAKKLARTERLDALSMESFKIQVASSLRKYLPTEAQEEIALLIKNMDVPTRKAFLSLKPRFWTQGSFQYDTLNNPYATPPQEMDIDDGTYLPMTMFANKPIIGHRLLLLLVDTSLKSLVHENHGWKFEAKRTCARLNIPHMNTHIDVPMYAIPNEAFEGKEEASLESSSEQMTKCLDSASSLRVKNRGYYLLDSNTVNLALRGDDEKWTKSDPKIVEDWFDESCYRIGDHLRDLCRFMKAWRDAQWQNGGGPSSILLMTATVNILDRIPHDKNDLGATMKLIAEHLPSEFSKGVISPDKTDEKLLFPSLPELDEKERDIMIKLKNLAAILAQADNASTQELALRAINQAFGQRVTHSHLIIRKQSAPAFKVEPAVQNKAKIISTTMSSG